MPTDIRTGGSIAGFELQALLGEGAMAAVYLARDATSGARVALKVLRPELAHDLRFRRRFLRESSVAAGLDHPHVVPTLASGEEDGHLYLVMAYVEGPTCARCSARGTARAAAGARPPRAGRRCAGRRPRRRARPPRREARQHPGHRAARTRARLRLRLRPRPTRLLGEERHRRPRLRRNDRLRPARADRGRHDRSPCRYLLARLRALRVPRRGAPV